ncbi:MAG TPA: rRNA pseudouridine synthase [bacterium]|nr:rRNA pseudouridine synthase [bacterium]
MQLNRYLSLCGIASRRQANTLIQEGRVRVNGDPVTRLGVRVEPERDAVTVDGKAVRPETRKRYVLLNKPPDVLTTVSDDRGRRTVTDLVVLPERVFPVGRLDHDTTGVLLLTNDGDLAYRLSHPRYEIQKVYCATVIGEVADSILLKFREGVEIDEGVFVKADVRILRRGRSGKTLLEFRIHEGKKRQIKRMCMATGHRVVSLERTCFAGLKTGPLKPGAWRELTSTEVRRLKELTGTGSIPHKG